MEPFQLPTITEPAQHLAERINAICQEHCPPAPMEECQQNVLEVMMALALCAASVLGCTEDPRGRLLFNAMVTASTAARQLADAPTAGNA